ncbi:MAG: energy transducer TonB [Methylobacillus sp.]|nr:energy transducer TonB [Methylobacillus sp.]
MTTYAFSLMSAAPVSTVRAPAAPRDAMPRALVAALAVHVLVLFMLARPAPESALLAPPLTVTLLAPEPALPTPAPEVVAPQPVPAKPQPVEKKVVAQPEKNVALAPVVAPEPMPVSVATEQISPASVVEASPPAVAKVAEPVAEASVEPPRFDAAYLENPAPSVPPLSRKAKEHGVVSLAVHVSASGAALEVKLDKSCGFERLDNSALETVKQWKFVPARRGDTPVAAWVTVPIRFNLKG